MLSPESLVNKLPRGFFMNPLMIKTNPESNSEIATVEAKVGERSKYSINQYFEQFLSLLKKK